MFNAGLIQDLESFCRLSARAFSNLYLLGRQYLKSLPLGLQVISTFVFLDVTHVHERCARGGVSEGKRLRDLGNGNTTRKQRNAYEAAAEHAVDYQQVEEGRRIHTVFAMGRLIPTRVMQLRLMSQSAS
jgi:hypothetical protein